MKIRDFLLLAKISVLSAVVGMVIGYIVGWKIDFNSILVVPIYCFFVYYCLVRFSEKLGASNVFGAIILGRCVLSIDVIFGYITGEVWSLPLFILTIWGMVSGYLFWSKKNLFRFLPMLMGLTFAGLMYSYGWSYWIHYSNFGTFTGRIHSVSKLSRFEVRDKEHITSLEELFESKLILVDFWNSRCGVCFEKFPQLEAGYQKYKHDDSVTFLAVNKPIQEDEPNQAFEMIQSKGFTFPVMVAVDENLPEKWGVKGYPTSFVFDRSGNVIFKGDIAGAIKLIDEIRSEETAAGL